MSGIEVPISPLVFVSEYEFDTSARLGCSQLCAVKKSSAPGESFCGKLIAADKIPSFLELEGSVYRTLRAHPHPSIALPLTVVEGGATSGLIYPPLQEDIQTYVRERKGLPEREARVVFREIVSAVRHCHKHRIVLRDLRPGKMFFKPPMPGSTSATREIVIADLDGSQIVSAESPFLTDRKGSPAFVSPEVVVAPAYDGAAADMWALGVTLYVLLTGTFPFQDTNPAGLFQKIQQGHTAVHFPATMSEAARDILRKLLVREPHLRMTADELIHDLWFATPDRSPLATAPAAPAPAPSTPATATPAAARKRGTGIDMSIALVASKRGRLRSAETQGESEEEIW